MPVLWIGASCLSKMNVCDGSGDMEWNGSSTFLRILGPWVWLVIQENSTHLSVLLHWQHTYPNPLIHLMRHCVSASVTGRPISSGLYFCWKSIFLFLSLTHSDSLPVCLHPTPTPHKHFFFSLPRLCSGYAAHPSLSQSFSPSPSVLLSLPCLAVAECFKCCSARTPVPE